MTEKVWSKGYARGCRSIKEMLLHALMKINDKEARDELENALKEIDQMIKKSEAVEEIS